ncbi:hypothetical protein EV122DRAFT_221297 [Schizophyllum commune]
MSRNVAFLWRRTIANVKGFPPYYPGTHELQWVDLLFGVKRCFSCKSTNGIVTVWLLRARYCERCLHSCRKYALSGLHETLVIDLRSLHESLSDRPCLAAECLFPVSVVTSYEVELATRAIDTDSLRAWMSEKREHLDGVKRHSQLCEVWEKRLHNAKCNRRQQAIVRQLTILGWSDELDRLPDGVLAEQDHVRSPEPLTMHDWHCMKDALLKFLRRMRTDRLRNEKMQALRARRHLLDQVYDEYRHTKPLGTILPGPQYFAKADVLRSVIYDIPFDQEVTAGMMLDALKSTPRSFLDDWRSRCEDQLVGFVQRQLDEIPIARHVFGTTVATRTTSSLAVAIFYDNEGNEDITYPSIFICPAATSVPLNNKRNPLGWSTQNLRWGGLGVSLVLRMISLVGGDPQTMTAREMDTLDPWFFLGTEAEVDTRIAYSWRSVIYNYNAERHEKLVLLGPEETATTRAVFPGTPVYSLATITDKVSLCGHCDSRFSEGQALLNHLTLEHDLSTVVWGDFIVGSDVLSRYRRVKLP